MASPLFGIILIVLGPVVDEASMAEELLLFICLQ
jgi:hypothetical protein